MRRLVTLIIAGLLAAITLRGLVWYRRLQASAAPASGTFPNGMAFAHLGTGRKNLLFLRGGTGVPFGRVFALLSVLWMNLFLQHGYTIWMVARKRGMPRGYTVEDMADDTAALIEDQFGGKVDLVIGEEAAGGMTAYCLAAKHPERFGHVAVMLAGYRMSDEGRAFERDLARLLGEGREDEAASLWVRHMVPDLRVPGVTPVLGALMLRFMLGQTYPSFAQDVMVEAEAVMAFDGRTILPKIAVPVLLISCDRDFEFPREVYEETTRLIPDCTLRLYEGKTGFQAGSDQRLPQDVLAFVRAHGDEDAEPLAEPTVYVKGVA